MTNQWLVTVLMPLAIALIMFGLGMSLTIQDFKRVYIYRKLVWAGLITQLILLPILCFAICILFDLPIFLAIGMMILAASPGGPSANLFSHLADADLALNISLTAVNSIIAIISVPLIINLSLWYFMPSENALGLNFVKTIEVIFIIAIPISLGMITRYKRPIFAISKERIVKVFSGLFLLLIIVLAVWQEWSMLTRNITTIGLAVIVFNLLSLSLGYWIPKILKATARQAFAVSIEIGIHNGTLAIYIAMHILGNAEMAIPAAVYSIFMYLSAFVFVYAFKALNKKSLNLE